MGRKSKVHENWSIRRHQDGAIGPRRDGSIDVKGRRKISLKALDFREFAGLAGKQLRGAESSAGTCPRLSSKTP
jgi:hypothetical protein